MIAMDACKRTPSLLLKSSPPRAIRSFLDRQQLQFKCLEARCTNIIAVTAPTGFGKTAQLNYWRREVLARGGLSFWLTLDSNDSSMRLIQGLTYSAQLSCGKRAFNDTFVHWIEQCSDPSEAITAWLAEVAELSVEVLLLLDDADRLPITSRTEVLSTLIALAPANLHIAIASRPSGALLTSGALSATGITRLTASDLRFSLDDTLDVLSSSLGGGCHLETAAEFHELNEGWPFGVQLAATALSRGGDLANILNTATENIGHFFIDAVIQHQSNDAVHLLVRLASFDIIDPALCSAVFGRGDLAEELIKLKNETPLFSQSEGSEWLRLHPLAREVLRERWSKLPYSERRLISQKACVWYTEHERYEEAAQQALIAGDAPEAFDLVERSTYKMTLEGKSEAVLAWYRRLSKDELYQLPGFWLPTAWALAMSNNHTEAQSIVKLILNQPNISAEERFEVALIEITAAGFADRIDLITKKLHEWPEAPPKSEKLLQTFTTAKSITSIFQGHGDQARLSLTQRTNIAPNISYSPVSSGLADYVIGLSHLWDGRFNLAEQTLQTALAKSEEKLTRNNPVSCMLAALLAQACWGAGKVNDPSYHLAGRLSILDRHGLPDALIAAYSTLGQIADHEGRQDQAISLFESLDAIGHERSMPRLQVTAQYELIRLHAKHSRADLASTLSSKLNTFLLIHQGSIPDIFLPWAHLYSNLACAYATLSQQDDSLLSKALTSVKAALHLATTNKKGQEQVEAQLLYAQILGGQGSEDTHTMKREAISLAKAYGMHRLISKNQSESGMTATDVPFVTKSNDVAIEENIYLRGAALLTPKENEVLSLLNHSLSNKEIARAMDVSEETIKWHMKNLFSKFNAGGRKHVIARAKMLGLVE